MSTGFTPAQVEAILTRDGGLCVLCSLRATTANHRLNRKAGGSKLRNGLSNGCAICDLCNNGIEDDPTLMRIAIDQGVKLREGQNPADTPMWHPFYQQWVELSDDALYLTGDTDKTRMPGRLL